MLEVIIGATAPRAEWCIKSFYFYIPAEIDAWRLAGVHMGNRPCCEIEIET